MESKKLNYAFVIAAVAMAIVLLVITNIPTAVAARNQVMPFPTATLLIPIGGKLQRYVWQLHCLDDFPDATYGPIRISVAAAFATFDFKCSPSDLIEVARSYGSRTTNPNRPTSCDWNLDPISKYPQIIMVKPSFGIPQNAGSSSTIVGSD
ncbi:hypothetical protein CCACVL1_21237 [Corchorus capsularis]|uniref:Uncharacterized protein n=1 Tax=Corchorus capsularis TaxID=210143 RepID=A0A1R3H7L6_COCAP|nr:hypothetical protein CCACVL1_21237 [Corchorus capsularis]